MYQLMGNVWTYTGEQEEPKKIEFIKIRKDTSKGHHVKNFFDLTSKVAKLAFLHPQWLLLFRGQREDYFTPKGLTYLYPTIYRDESDKKALRKKVKQERFDELESKAKRLLEEYPRHFAERTWEISRLKKHVELCWALIQHYEIAATPYLDVSSSLRVAASFALRESRSGYVYVFAMPYPTGSISHFVDYDIKIVRLQAACPPSAKRPHFQEGYLIGSCYIKADNRHSKENASSRLLAKFFIDDKDSFWTKNEFDPIPEEALLPKSDIDLEWLRTT